MRRRRPILIGCPQHGRLVPGTYACDDAGAYRLGPDGTFLLEHARCGHDGGRCAQTLCALHRFNRGGTGSWYPGRIVPVAPAGPAEPGPSADAPPAATDDGPGFLA